MFPSTSFARAVASTYRTHKATVTRGGATILRGAWCSCTEQYGTGPNSNDALDPSAVALVAWRLTFDPELPVALLPHDRVLVTRSDGSTLPAMNVVHVRETGNMVERIVFCAKEASSAPTQTFTFERYDDTSDTTTTFGPYPAQVTWRAASAASTTGTAASRQLGDMRVSSAADVQVGDTILELAGGMVVSAGDEQADEREYVVSRDAGWGGAT
jgi:hypothetical protein